VWQERMNWLKNSAKWSEMAESDSLTQWSETLTQARMQALKKTANDVFQGQNKPENTRASKTFSVFIQDAHVACAPCCGRFENKTK